MPFPFVSVEEAVARDGLRMVVVGGVPSPWGEAAKGILHIKRIEWVAVRLVYDSDLLKQWAGERSGPVAVYAQEPPRSGWADILALAERLAPTPSLLPADAADRALVLDLARQLCGESGLGWSRRLQLVHVGLQQGQQQLQPQQNAGGFAPRVAAYLGKKYGYSPEVGATCGDRVVELLGAFAARLKAQHAAGSRYLVGNTLTAADIYCATVMALFAPLPESQCRMDPATRAAFETRDERTAAALDPVLLAHRDFIYATHLELPLAL